MKGKQNSFQLAGFKSKGYHLSRFYCSVRQRRQSFISVKGGAIFHSKDISFFNLFLEIEFSGSTYPPLQNGREKERKKNLKIIFAINFLGWADPTPSPALPLTLYTAQ